MQCQEVLASDTLCHLETNKLAYQRLMAAERRHEIPGSATKDFVWIKQRELCVPSTSVCPEGARQSSPGVSVGSQV